MGRPRKAAVITTAPFDAKASVEGASIKQLAKERAFDKEENKAKVITSLRELTQSAITVKNYPVREFQALSPEPSDWGVAYYFPVAKDDEGKIVPTYVDTPQTDRQWKLCSKKAEVMERLGLRYCVFRQEALLTSENLKATIAERVSGDSMINEGHLVSL